MYLEYLYILKYSMVFLIIGLILFFISFFFVYQKPTMEKISAYECGFNPFGDARSKFEIRYYLVAILFIIFDLELLFLFPWVYVLIFYQLLALFLWFFLFLYLL